MRRAVFLGSVRADFLEIFTYVAEQSGSIAVGRSFVARLRSHCHKLASFEGTIGRSRPELRPDIRSAPFGNYVVFFRYNATRFEVVAIVEGHRDIDAWFAGRKDV